MKQSPYVCRVCGASWQTPYIRCIGLDGRHRPTVTVPREGTRYDEKEEK